MSVETHVAELERPHRALETEIAEAHAHPSIDDLQIVSLKRRKLLVKDELGGGRQRSAAGNCSTALRGTTHGSTFSHIGSRQQLCLRRCHSLCAHDR
jgi:hypothetical protein